MDGPVWSGEGKPRLWVIDERTDARRSSDERNQVHPSARVEVRCLIGDLHIDHIVAKMKRRSGFSRSGHPRPLGRSGGAALVGGGQGQPFTAHEPPRRAVPPVGELISTDRVGALGASKSSFGSPQNFARIPYRTVKFCISSFWSLCARANRAQARPYRSRPDEAKP